MLISAEGWKDKKAGRRERAGRKKRRSRGIFRIEFPRWFPWFGATARKEERVGASFFFTLAIPLAATPSFPRLKFFSPFPSPNPPYFPFSASSILQLSPRLLPPLLNSPFFSLFFSPPLPSFRSRRNLHLFQKRNLSNLPFPSSRTVERRESKETIIQLID